MDGFDRRRWRGVGLAVGVAAFPLAGIAAAPGMNFGAARPPDAADGGGAARGCDGSAVCVCSERHVAAMYGFAYTYAPGAPDLKRDFAPIAVRATALPDGVSGDEPGVSLPL